MKVIKQGSEGLKSEVVRILDNWSASGLKHNQKVSKIWREINFLRAS